MAGVEGTVEQARTGEGAEVLPVRGELGEIGTCSDHWQPMG